MGQRRSSARASRLHPVASLHRQIRSAAARQRFERTHPPHRRADIDRLGKSDGVVAPAYADEFARRIAHARVAMSDGAGHIPHFEQAQKVAQLVGDF